MWQKLFLAWCALFYAGSPSADNLIDWSASRKLSWSDFKADPDPASTNAALTSSAINVQFGYNERGFKHSITCRFDKSKSWVRVRTPYILNHEQGHFDLAEAYARKLHQALLAYHFKAQGANEALNEIYTKVMEEHVKVQDQYDVQTNHSLDTARQAVWDGKIRGLLAQEEAFKDYQ